MPAPWNLPERDVTPEPVVLSRRQWLKRSGLATAGLAVGGLAWWAWPRPSNEEVLEAGEVAAPPVDVYPAERNPRFAAADRPLTDEATAARYCNFYEFSSTKAVYAHVGPFRTEPWTLEVAGLVRNPVSLDTDGLLRTFALEERVYRHRCVETWAMVVPWVGFPLADLVRLADPLPDARYVRFVSFYRPSEASRQRSASYPWPYAEGLTLAEATNELAFVATGMYGHPLLKQHGAPVRLVVPWKYGFKSAKSLARIEFVADRPASFWNTLAPHEYDFQANVNPEVPHPRWSQAGEWMLGTGERFPTRPYNGYGEWVAHLYR